MNHSKRKRKGTMNKARKKSQVSLPKEFGELERSLERVFGEELLQTKVVTYGISNIEDVVDNVIPFKLSLASAFFCKENYDSLFYCLTHLRSNLFELEITYPEDGGTLPVNFPNLKLPSLRVLSFEFSDENLVDEDDNDDNVVAFGNNARGMGLLQSIINASEKLENFVHPFTLKDVIPQDFGFLWLPTTISSLEFNMKLKNTDLNILLRNDLPNIQYLTLLLNEIPFEDDLLYKILERVQKSLKYFRIEGLTSDGNPRLKSHLRFPIMEHLEEIDISSTECNLGPLKVFDLHDFLPNLKSLTLKDQTEPSFNKWTGNATFKKVHDLTLSLVNDNFGRDDDNYYLSPDLELITDMHMVFPNILELYLTFNISNITCLKYIFQGMTKLTTLQISLHGNFDDCSSDLFDSTVLGLPVKVVTCLREHGDLYEKVEFKSCDSSIRNLSDLTTLGLYTKPIPEDEEFSLLSETLMNHAFLKMTILKHLVLYGKFKITHHLIKLWEDDGGTVQYYNDNNSY